MRVEWQSVGGTVEADAARRLPHAVRLTFAAALSAYLATAAWLLWRTAILSPYSDMFDWIERYYRFQADGDLGSYLWAPHNFHHLVWTFGILALDIRAFGADSYLFLATGAACLAATAAMLAWLGAQAAGPGLRLVGAGGAAALALMGCHVLDASADINVTYLHALVFAVAALVLSEQPQAARAGPRALALLFAVLSGLGSAAGLAVWPALLFGAWRRGERRWAATLFVAASGFALLYSLGDGTLAPVGGGVHSLPRIAEAAVLAVDYLGLPWMRGVPDFGWLVGAAVLAASLAALVAVVRGGGRLERLAAGLILFSLATAVMAGVARAGVAPPSLTPIRYAVFLIPLHVGLWIMALPHLRRAWLARPRAMQGLVLAAAALMVVHQGVMGVYATRTADTNRAVIAAFHAGARTAPMLTTIYPDLAKAQALSARMRRDGLYQRELRPLNGSGSGV